LGKKPEINFDFQYEADSPSQTGEFVERFDDNFNSSERDDTFHGVETETKSGNFDFQYENHFQAGEYSSENIDNFSGPKDDNDETYEVDPKSEAMTCVPASV